MKDDLDRLIDEIEAERPGFRARVEAALAARREGRLVADLARVVRSRGLSVRDAAALLGLTPAGLKLHDARLMPARDSSGRRIYDRAAVMTLRAERADKVRKPVGSRRRRAS